MPGVAFACRYRFNTLGGDTGSHKNGDGGRLAHTPALRAGYRVGRGLHGRNDNAVGLSSRGPQIALCARGCECGGLELKDGGVARDGYNRDWKYGEMERVHLGTTVGIEMCVGVVSTLPICRAVPLV